MTATYLNHAEAVAFARMCEQTSTLILGIERFVQTDDQVKPDLTGIADFSRELEQGGIERNIASVDRFLALYGREADERFEFVVAD